jgi:hypothetical protein
MNPIHKVCPECGHEFKGNGWDGVDAHWKLRHAHVMSYDEAWPLIKAGEYMRRESPFELNGHAAFPKR